MQLSILSSAQVTISFRWYTAAVDDDDDDGDEQSCVEPIAIPVWVGSFQSQDRTRETQLQYSALTLTDSLCSLHACRRRRTGQDGHIMEP